MELKELHDKTLSLFGVTSADQLGEALILACDKEEKLEAFCELVDNDLSKDWLQMIWQYYMADRENKKQDYTPACLAKLLSCLVGESDTTVDMCAGSGALTIQRWLQQPKENTYELYEIDDRVIPFLVFNMVLRNISCTVHHADVLQSETFKTYRIEKGERFGKVVNIESTI